MERINLSCHSRKDDGFTMVEILVVIIIIGILTAIAIPIYINQRKAAHDSALKSDLRNAASAVMAWQGAGNSNDELLAAAGTSTNGYQRKALHITGENTEHALTFIPPEANGMSGAKRWNEAFPEYAITATDGVAMEVIMRDVVSAGEHLADDGDFCVIGSHNHSNYTYKYGTGGTKPTDPHLEVMFYDSALGGLKTMDELVDMPNGEEGGCGVHVSRYKKLVGAA